MDKLYINVINLNGIIQGSRPYSLPPTHTHFPNLHVKRKCIFLFVEIILLLTVTNFILININPSSIFPYKFHTYICLYILYNNTYKKALILNNINGIS